MKVKEFCKKHEKAIAVVGGVVGIAIGVVVYKRLNTKKVADVTELVDLSIITWKTTEEKHISLEEVKAILDATANNSHRFAIFREGSIPSQYVCISLDD